MTQKRFQKLMGESDMKSKKTLVIAAILMLFIVTTINIFKEDLWNTNAELLKEKVLSIGESVETVTLTDVTPFEWDTVYSFNPYTPKDTIYKTVGYKWDSITETVSEGMNQIVFLKDKKVVCYLYGYPENNGFAIFFASQGQTETNSASELRINDDLAFKVNKSNNVIYLSNN